MINPISVELARQLADDRAARLRRGRRRIVDVTEPARGIRPKTQ